MTGKAYTMKEMKSIVDYLVEHKAYGTIRGRKMWMDFSNSSITNRSWQSLKETFLKRILPDIHNPYYKLTRDQIQSFRQGVDVREKERNKLEIHTLSDDSGSNADTPNGIEKPSTSKQNEEEKGSGEDIPSKISSRNRSSADTVILETCYETAEDVIRDLDSPSTGENPPNEPDDISKAQSKSLRDLITYSEPLTPMLQEVLHDFETDDSDSGDPKMQIVENAPETDEQGNASPRRVPDLVKKSPKKNKETNHENVSNESDKFVEPKVKSLRLRKREGVYVPVTELKPSENPTADTAIDTPTKNSDEINGKSNGNNVEDTEPSVTIVNDSNEKPVDKLIISTAQSTQNSSSSTADTLLPNNQEALKKAAGKNESSDFNKTNLKAATETRKRTVSREILDSQETNNDKLNEEIQKPASDTVATQEKAQTIEDSDVTNASEADKKKETNTTKDVTRKSSEIDTQDVLPPNKTANELNTPTQSSQINPCLQSVSLYAEQFNLTKYLDSASSNDGEPSPESVKESTDKRVVVVEKPTKKDPKEVVILKSHSDTESDSTKETPPSKKNNKQIVPKAKRDKVLANMFGFSSGAVTSKRKRLSSYRKQSAPRHFHGHNSSAESSEWTSESDSDYVSPPRGRRNRQTRKYLKPKSARIHSLEDEGGLFVMYGKKIYPLVKDGRTIKNYLIYSPDSDPDNEENYWKQKFVEERKRVEELKKFIKQSEKEDERDPSPLLPTKSSRSHNKSQDLPAKSKPVTISDSEDRTPKEEVKQKQPVVEPNNKTLKITFAKNNQEVQLEGHWSQLHPVLSDVVEIFHKDANMLEPSTKKTEPNLPEEIRSKTPIVLAPIDEEAHDKVNKLETEIFKEIEERDQEEGTETKDPVDNNVTKRKRPNRLLSTTSEPSVAQNPSPESSRKSKRVKTSEGTEEETKVNVEEKVDENEATDKDTEEGTKTPLVAKSSKGGVTTKKTRTPKKEPKDTIKTVTSNESKTRAKKSKLAVADEANKSDDDGEEVKYMFPPKKTAKASTGKASQATKR